MLVEPVRRSSVAFSRKNKLRFIRMEFSALASLHCRKDRNIRSSYVKFTSYVEWYSNFLIFIYAFPVSDAVSISDRAGFQPRGLGSVFFLH